MLTLRNADARGQADLGWLKSRHSFSFGRYYDAKHMGFSALRVINDDWVAAGAGFDTHGHRDMEIITLVLQGAIVHQDSAGNQKVLPAGEFQLMSAGSGIYHSEFNASASEPLRFLQIWIQPESFGGKPGYQQQAFAQTQGLTLIASPDGRDHSMQLKQQALLYRLALAAGQPLSYALTGKNLYLHLISGQLQLEGVTLQAGDAVMLSLQALLQLTANEEVDALVFDLP